jgi:cell division protein FtsI (penicillin-binding protein 3)
MLVGAVDRGTGKKAAVDGYTVAGKTGTAQKVDPGGGYSRRKVLASFVGFVPAEDPQAVILVMLDEPEKDRWGGTAAAPVFKRVAEQALHHLQVPSRYARPLTLEAQRMGDGG